MENNKQETLADKLKKLLDNMSQEEFNEEWKKVTDLKLEGPSIIQHVELINKNIDEFDSKVKEFKEKQKQRLIDIMKADEELGLYEEPKQETLEEAAEREASLFYEKGSLDWNKYRQVFIEGTKWQQDGSYSKEEVDKMFDTLKRNSINNVATIANVDLFISSWKREFKK